MADQPLKTPPGSNSPPNPFVDEDKAVAPGSQPDKDPKSRMEDQDTEEPYLLIRRGFEVSVKTKSSAMESVKNFVSTGCLTPVLGSEMTDAWSVPGQAITRDMVLEADARPELLAFHSTLFAERSLDRVEIDDPRPQSARKPEADGAITNLRLALLEAAYQATKLYASAWSGSVAPVFEWTLHAVCIGKEQEASLSTLIKALESAENAISTFREAQTVEQDAIDHRKDLLGADGLGARLRHLREVVGQGGALRGSTVEWLTDVLWHVLIFDSPCYPTREELALQISLAVENESPIEKVELTALAPLGIGQDWAPYRYAMSRNLTGLRDGSGGAQIGALHLALAASLNQSYCRWRQACGQASDSKGPAPVSLAITLTTDLELERALATEKGSGRYHVAFPMVFTSALHNNRGHLRWVVGTFESGLDSDKEGFWPKLVRPVDGWRLLNDVAESFVLSGYSAGLKGGLEGPLVLKANGSPLHEVEPDLADNPALLEGFLGEILKGNHHRVTGRRGGRALHVPATTELDILQLSQVDQWAMGSQRGRAGLPTFIRKLLEEPTRNWLLLGHDLGEWSSRLQLFTQISLSWLVQPSKSGMSNVKDRSLAVVRKADEQRTRLLAGMDIPLTDYAALQKGATTGTTGPDVVAKAIRVALPKTAGAVGTR